MSANNILIKKLQYSVQCPPSPRVLKLEFHGTDTDTDTDTDIRDAPFV